MSLPVGVATELGQVAQTINFAVGKQSYFVNYVCMYVREIYVYMYVCMYQRLRHYQWGRCWKWRKNRRSRRRVTQTAMHY